MDHPPKSPALWLFSLLILPLGIVVVGFNFTAFPLLLAQAGVPVDQIANVGSIINLPGVLGFLFAPVVDIKFRRRTWLVLATFGTALSVCLYFPLIGASHLALIEGGTHNPAAPPFDFLQRCFIPLIERMGPKVKLELQRYGFYPAGGGRIVVEISPTDTLKPIELEERREITTKRATAFVANLPYHIARRELDTVGKLLNWDAESLRCEDTKKLRQPRQPGDD